MKMLKKIFAGIFLFCSISVFSLDISNLNGAFSLIKLTGDNDTYSQIGQINLVKEDKDRGDYIKYTVQSEERSLFPELVFHNVDGKIYVEMACGIMPVLYEVTETKDFELKLVNIDNPEDVLILSYNKYYNEFDYQGYYRYLEVLKDEELKDKLHELVSNHHYLGYDGARDEMFEKIDNVEGYVRCVYTGKMVRTDSIPDGTIMNTEHTWPQSKFGGGESTSKKSDLFHLFPTDSKANSRRSSYNFDNVVGDVKWEDNGSKLGDNDAGYTAFEPRDDHKGDVARALFYFSVRYNMSIPPYEEDNLREWHESDPVDENEFRRNSEIEERQHNRNPFIDQPELVNNISDF